ncbi:hypothetical protein Hdeb2414_s0003g00108041 [Helianthus debilis subsp. tardiflorus]
MVLWCSSAALFLFSPLFLVTLSEGYKPDSPEVIAPAVSSFHLFSIPFSCIIFTVHV